MLPLFYIVLESNILLLLCRLWVTFDIQRPHSLVCCIFINRFPKFFLAVRLCQMVPVVRHILNNLTIDLFPQILESDDCSFTFRQQWIQGSKLDIRSGKAVLTTSGGASLREMNIWPLSGISRSFQK